MYAVYKYNAGATTSNILSDLVALLTGTTDVQTLSASCDKALSTVTASVRVAGWTLHDAAAAAGRQVVRSPLYDNASKFKFLSIDVNTAGYLRFGSNEFWNETSHTGTNSIYVVGTVPWESSHVQYLQRINTATGGYVYISASERCVAFHTLQSGSYGNSQCNGFTALSEFTRWSPWDTSTNAYPNWIFCNAGSGQGFGGTYGAGGNSAWVHRYKNTVGSDTVTGSAGVALAGPMPGGGNGLATLAKILDATGSYIVPLVPVIAATATTGYFGGNISEQSDIWYIPSSGTMLDEITVNGNTYVIWQTTFSSGLGDYSRYAAVRKG